ncbi:hypothetical protein ACHHYP_13181 [Achlya hypogyna]|uniref:Transmembrane protein n=1 Tax=Achlya hypogyna TaxID=1202772 RepID=A0A1V9YFX2_ACHHY|nr:hypothetical protein ACHHYP_13181 [Achlya hypogyna]
MGEANATATPFPTLNAAVQSPTYAKVIVGIVAGLVFLVGFIACYIIVRRAAAYNRALEATASDPRVAQSEVVTGWFKHTTPREASSHAQSSLWSERFASPLALASPRETDASSEPSLCQGSARVRAPAVQESPV